MKVVILCGGQGTRIRDVTSDVPKPMIPVGEYPILWHIMRHYAHYGHKAFILCLGYQGQAIKDFFLNYRAHTSDFTLSLGSSSRVEYHNAVDEIDWQVTLADTGLHAMTGARIKRIEKYLGNDESFMLTYGDGVGSVDLARLVEFHCSHEKVMTVTGVQPMGRFGEMEADGSGRVLEFNEKPQATQGMISGGFFVCRRELFDYLPDREDLVLEEAPMRALVRDGELMVYRHDGFWQCMDTYRDYKLLNGLWESGRAAWKAW